MSSVSWKKVTVRAPARMEEVVADFLTTLTGRGVSIREEGESVLIDAFLDHRSGKGQMPPVERFLEDLVEHGDLPEGTKASVFDMPEEDWMSVFRSQHASVIISEKLAVRPTWCEPTGPDDIVLDPGMAFGTGSHATTRMCLELLDTVVGEPSPGGMLDIGTGSGILAIAGAFLGVRDILAVDIDPISIEVAVANVRNNCPMTSIRVEVGGIEKAQGTYDVITANLTSSLLTRLAKEIGKRLAPGGNLIVSGIMSGETGSVLSAFKACGLEPDRVLESENWVAVLFRNSILKI